VDEVDYDNNCINMATNYGNADIERLQITDYLRLPHSKEEKRYQDKC